MPEDKEKIEEQDEPLKVSEPEVKPLAGPTKTKSSNIDDDLGNQLTGTEKTDLTDAGATILHKHDHGALDGLDDNDHGAIYYTEAEVDAAISTAIEAVATYSSTVSANLRNSNDTERSTDSLTYVKVKECKLNADLAACRIKFDLKANRDGNDAFGKIYKNGVAEGTEQSTALFESFETFSEDFADFESGDLIQLYMKGSHDNDQYCQNMQFYYDGAITHLKNNLLDTALASAATVISITNQDPV